MNDNNQEVDQEAQGGSIPSWLPVETLGDSTTITISGTVTVTVVTLTAMLSVAVTVNVTEARQQKTPVALPILAFSLRSHADVM